MGKPYPLEFRKRSSLPLRAADYQSAVANRARVLPRHRPRWRRLEYGARVRCTGTAPQQQRHLDDRGGAD
jgi:hypothetical protein